MQVTNLYRAIAFVVEGDTDLVWVFWVTFYLPVETIGIKWNEKTSNE